MKEKERKEAVALRYDEKRDPAPVVAARGKGEIAEKILETARKHGVPVYEDAALSHLLMELDINQSIPEHLYRAVAEVFAFLYRLDKSMAMPGEREGK